MIPTVTLNLSEFDLMRRKISKLENIQDLIKHIKIKRTESYRIKEPPGLGGNNPYIDIPEGKMSDIIVEIKRIIEK